MNGKLVKLSDTLIRDLLYMEDYAKIALPYIIERGKNNDKLTGNDITIDAWNIAKSMYNERINVIKLLMKEYENE